MSGQVIRLDTATHDTVQALLPWHVMQCLDDEDLQKVEAHLAGCQRCQLDLAFERKLEAVHVTPGLKGDVEGALAKLLPRLDRRRSGSLARRWYGMRAAWSQSAPWLRWTLSTQFVAIALLSALLVIAPSGTGRYRALGSPGRVIAGNAMVVFKPETSEQSVRWALKESGARVVDGPTISGAYVLDIANAAALEHLRQQPVVLHAESIDAGAQP